MCGMRPFEIRGQGCEGGKTRYLGAGRTSNRDTTEGGSTQRSFLGPSLNGLSLPRPQALLYAQECIG